MAENFEVSLEDSSTKVASFDDEKNGFLSWIQSTLHQNPSLVPLIVLTASIAGFGLYLGP